ncbi:alpha/beta hydrolase [Saccharopolyspora taberi]|uniref:Acyl-CoA:diacylglycerol acyltransferase n=1 Tax=Saccharopolyspora taberi TaxID=60895 RepID=A0ABN3V4M3_9PSEU
MSSRKFPTRRGFLAAAGAGAVLAGAGVATDVLPGGPWLRRHLGLTGADGVVPQAPAQAEFVSRRSAARSREVELMITAPAGSRPERLPVCLALHGRGSSARGMAGLGLPQFLTAQFLTATGARPFTVVAPDGGEHYWHDDGAGDDPMRMLLEEIPVWLAELGLAAPSAALGISMGGFGALSHPAPLKAVISPALFGSWEESRPLNAFPAREVWEANDPLRHAARIDGRGLGIWCGTADVFYERALDLADRTNAVVTSFEPGDHTDGYWRRALPDALRYLGQRLA